MELLWISGIKGNIFVLSLSSPLPPHGERKKERSCVHVFSFCVCVEKSEVFFNSLLLFALCCLLLLFFLRRKKKKKGGL